MKNNNQEYSTNKGALSMYYPDSWVILKINPDKSDKPLYKVFVGFHGGYLYGDSWRVNSGITSFGTSSTFDFEGSERIIFKGASGSEYCCPTNAENRLGMYCNSVLSQFIKEAEGAIEVISFEDFKKEFKSENEPKGEHK